jgi:hypothetical protein
VVHQSGQYTQRILTNCQRAMGVAEAAAPG